MTMVKEIKWNEIPEDEYDEKDSEVVKFVEDGDVFIGIFRGIVEYKNERGEGKFYKFEDPEDEDKEYVIFPTAVLETKFKKVPLDALVKVVYKGMKKSEKSIYSYKDYDVFTSK